MKPDFQKLISQSHRNSFKDFWVVANAFGFHWHYHPEIEICYVQSGKGKKIIGNCVEDFKEGDLTIVGPNVPHTWITDEHFNLSNKTVEVYVVQFDIEIMAGFMHMPECSSIKKLMESLQGGCIQLENIEKESFAAELLEIAENKGFHKLLSLLGFLERFGTTQCKRVLNTGSLKANYKKYQENRITKVCTYIHNNFRNRISVESVAQMISMNTSSFCRFFKRSLGKTVVEYINELRVSFACQMLVESEEPIYIVAYESGYSSISHFNKQFKKMTRKTPKEYQHVFKSNGHK